MRIIILNGNQDPQSTAFEGYLTRLREALEFAGHTVALSHLRNIKFHGCTGCFSCWVKTPGLCIFKDDFENLLRAFVKSDLVMYASPLSMGYLSALTKKAIDRSIPVILPFIDTSTGECRHFPRYDRIPRLGFLYENEKDTDAEDISILRTLLKRFVRNANSTMAFFGSTTQGIEEVCREIDRP